MTIISIIENEGRNISLAPLGGGGGLGPLALVLEVIVLEVLFAEDFEGGNRAISQVELNRAVGQARNRRHVRIPRFAQKRLLKESNLWLVVAIIDFLVRCPRADQLRLTLGVWPQGAHPSEAARVGSIPSIHRATESHRLSPSVRVRVMECSRERPPFPLSCLRWNVLSTTIILKLSILGHKSQEVANYHLSE